MRFEMSCAYILSKYHEIDGNLQLSKDIQNLNRMLDRNEIDFETWKKELRKLGVFEVENGRKQL